MSHVITSCVQPGRHSESCDHYLYRLQDRSKEGMDEYEVKVHALEDIEEGEVTSDEEGEIKGQPCDHTHKSHTIKASGISIKASNFS